MNDRRIPIQKGRCPGSVRPMWSRRGFCEGCGGVYNYHCAHCGQGSSMQGHYDPRYGFACLESKRSA